MQTAHVALRALGLTSDADEREVRRAYARELKAIDQELQAEAFQTLRGRYELALDYVRQRVQDAYEETLPEPAGLEASAAPVSFEPQEQSVPQVAPAQAVFEKLLRELATQDVEIGYAQRLLDQSLASPELVSLDQRELFEYLLVVHLALGWQAGNEALFSVAVQHFQWKSDRRRLQIFGAAGATIDDAVLDLIGFNKQPQSQRERQLGAIRRTRIESSPSKKDRILYAKALEMVAEKFPRLLRIITSQSSVDNWLVQSADYLKKEAVKPQKPSLLSRVPWLVWWFIAMTVFHMLKN
jgi:hypothetical protein